MKKLFILCVIIFGYYICKSQVPVDSYKPYLITNNKISSVSNMSLNKDSGQTDKDTIICFVEIIDMKSGVQVFSKSTGLMYHVSFWIKAYGLWVHDSYIGNHWDLFSDKFKLLRLIPGIVIGKIVEVN